MKVRPIWVKEPDYSEKKISKKCYLYRSTRLDRMLQMQGILASINPPLLLCSHYFVDQAVVSQMSGTFLCFPCSWRWTPQHHLPYMSSANDASYFRALPPSMPASFESAPTSFG